MMKSISTNATEIAMSNATGAAIVRKNGSAAVCHPLTAESNTSHQPM